MGKNKLVNMRENVEPEIQWADLSRQEADEERFGFVFAVLPVNVSACVCVSVERWVASGGLLIRLNEPVKVIKALGRQERR